jgi:apolipoprotein N-acyltransferase
MKLEGKIVKSAMAVLSGLLLFLSFPKFGSGLAVWVALVPLLFALRDADPKEAFKTGFLTGMVAHVGILYWISHVVVQYGYLPLYVGLAVMLLLAAYLSLYTACFAMGVVFFRKRGISLIWSAPLLWPLLEYLRAHLLTGFPWENLGYSQYLHLNLIQVADITGVYGISFLIVLVNAVLCEVLFAATVDQREGGAPSDTPPEAEVRMSSNSGHPGGSRGPEIIKGLDSGFRRNDVGEGTPSRQSCIRGNDNVSGGNAPQGKTSASCDLVTSRKPKWPITGIAVSCVLLVLVYAYGHFRATEIRNLLEKAPASEVALIQGNIDQNIKWNPDYQSETVNIYRTLSLSAVPDAGGLIVWPETSAPFYFEEPGPLRDAVIDLTRSSGRTLLFGSPRYEMENGKISFMNSAYLLRPDGVVAGLYDKVHLVPYGEYVPLRKFFPFIGKLVAGIGDFRPGQGWSEPLAENGRRLGVLICYEGILPEAARDYKRGGADLLVNITNDAWFGKTSAPYQHLSMTAFRAIETRLFLVRAANTGVSAIIDPTGKILSQTGIFERTVLKGAIKFIDDKTFYAAYGDIFIYLCGIALILSYLIKRRRSEHA